LKKFKGMVKRIKRSFFNEKIQEITSKNKCSWELMNWVKKHKLPAMEALTLNQRIFGKPFIKHSIWLKIIISIYIYLMKSHYDLNLSDHFFPK